MGKSSVKAGSKALAAEAASKYQAEWNYQVRALAALRHRWLKTAIDLNLDEEEKGKRLHILETKERSILAWAWTTNTASPPTWGDGKHREVGHKDAPKIEAVNRLRDEGRKLHILMLEIRMARHRRRRGLPDPEPIPQVEPSRIIDIELDDLDNLESAMNMPSSPIPPKRFKPGQVPQPGQGRRPAPPAGQPAPGRPRTPATPGMTVQRALDYEIPFGKFRGNTIGSLVENREGLSYLYWLANEADIRSNSLAEAIEAVYEVYQTECEESREYNR